MARKLKNRLKPNDQLFAEYFDIIHNSYSPAYYKEATRVLGQYRAFIGGAAPSLENFSTFFLRYRELKTNTRSRYHCIFSAFFKWYSSEKLPFTIKSAKLKPQMVSDEEVETLKKCLMAKRSHKQTLDRDLLLIDIMCLTGLRRGEVATLRVRDLKLDGDPALMVKGGKGGKDRVVPLNQTITKLLKNFTTGKAANDSVFGLSAKSLSTKFNLWAVKAGVPSLHPHSFRHKFATDLLQRGVDLRTVQELLGHESVEMTQRYTAITDANKKQAVSVLDNLPPDTTTDSADGAKSPAAVSAGASPDDINATIAELEACQVKVGEFQLPGATVLLKFGGKFAAGLTPDELVSGLVSEFSLSGNDAASVWAAATELLEEFSWQQLIRPEQRQPGGKVKQQAQLTYWLLTDYGKVVGRVLRRANAQPQPPEA